MRIREGEIQALAAAVTRALQKQGLVRFKVAENVIQRRFAEIIAKTFEDERALEAEAERLAEKHGRQLVGMDFHKIVTGIMERLARDRDFPL